MVEDASLETERVLNDNEMDPAPVSKISAGSKGWPNGICNIVERKWIRRPSNEARVTRYW